MVLERPVTNAASRVLDTTFGPVEIPAGKRISEPVSPRATTPFPRRFSDWGGRLDDYEAANPWTASLPEPNLGRDALIGLGQNIGDLDFRLLTEEQEAGVALRLVSIALERATEALHDHVHQDDEPVALSHVQDAIEGLVAAIASAARAQASAGRIKACREVVLAAS
jgi:hypothetical protein